MTRRRRTIRRALLVSLVVVVAGVAAGWSWLADNVLADLPSDLSHLKDYRPLSSCRVFDAQGRQIDEFWIERRVWVGLDAVPAHVPHAFVAAEDQRFFDHPGVDLFGIVRAFVANLRTGRVAQGGSTITQQLVKNLVIGGERSYKRKLKEAILAFRLEDELSKRQLLELYVNFVYLGAGNHGVEAAARDYFGVGAAQLDPGQAALLAGLVPAPSRYAPIRYPEEAAVRRRIVLDRMVAGGYLTEAQAAHHFDDPVIGKRTEDHSESAAAYVTVVRRELRRLFGNEWLMTRGLAVTTPLDSKLQALAEDAVVRALVQLEDRQKKKNPELSADGAAIVMETATGRIRALTGGRRMQLEGFVRATQARRQPGSSFKPFVYAAALQRGRSQLNVVADAPISLPAGGGRRWSPRNYDGRFRGPVTLRTAMAQSINTVAIRLVFEVGVDRVAHLAEAMGVETPLRRDPTMALGSSEVTLLDLVTAYTTIARMGEPIERVLVDRIVDRTGRVLGVAGDQVEGRWTLPGRALRRALEPGVAYQLADMLRAVVQIGTARRARNPGEDRAGKTGTTNDFVDAWFVGFTPKHTVGIWIGTDGHRTLGESETGGRTALPAWIEIVNALGDGGRLPIPDDAMLVQEGGTMIAVTRGRGRRALEAVPLPLPE